MNWIKKAWQEQDGGILEYLIVLAFVGVVAAYIMPQLREETSCMYEGALSRISIGISKSNTGTGPCQALPDDEDLIEGGTPPPTTPPPSGGGGTTPPPPVDTSTDATVALPTEKDAGGCYVIRTVGQLQAMKLDLNGCYILGNDIEATGTVAWNGGKGFEPVGPSFNDEFRGYLDGKNHSIKGLYIDRPLQNDVGLFGNVNSLGDEGIVNLKLIGPEVTGSDFVGSLMGRGYPAELKNIEVVDAKVWGSRTIGGLGGYYGHYSCTSCHVSGTIIGLRHVGGLFGEGSAIDMIRSSFDGSITLHEESQAAGGLVGFLGNYSTISESYSSGNLSSQHNMPTLGGLVGLAGQIEVSNSYSSMDLSIPEVLDPTDYPTLGGLFGSIGPSSITNSYANGFYNRDYTMYGVGGIAGKSYNDCSRMVVQSTYWNEERSGITSTPCDNATGVDTLELMSTIPLGWNFGSIWDKKSHINNGFPYLRNNPPN